tara:strand:+ start:10729 stop:12594 length:1866 start_codon:yes stop_codon:yes gene_type:complete
MNWVTKLSSLSKLPKATNYNIELSKLSIGRIIIGGLMSARVIMLINSALSYYPNSENIIILGAIFLILSVCFMIGFLTPIVNVILLIFWGRLDYFMGTYTLASTILLLLLSLYLFVNIAGLSISADNLIIKKRKSFSKLIISTYNIFGRPSIEKINTLYFLTFMTYGLISLGAALYHVHDQSWIEGSTLLQLFTSSHLCKFYYVFRDFHSYYPSLFLIISKLTIFGQTIFQILMIPLIFNKYTYHFVNFWTLGFILSSLFFIQLSSLPHMEVIYWFIIFYKPKNKNKLKILYDDYCNLCKKTITTLKSINFNESIIFLPISKNQKTAQNFNLSLHDLNKEMYGIYNNKILKGYDVYLKTSILNPILFFFWPILYIGKVSSIGKFIYNYVSINRLKYFGTCKFSFDVNNEKTISKIKEQKNNYFNLFVKITFIGYLILVLFKFPYISDISYNILTDNGQESVYYKIKFWLKRTPLDPPFVFNESDLTMSHRWAVLYRKKKNKKNIVPIVNLDGSRMNYNNFDWFYFQNFNSDILTYYNVGRYRRGIIDYKDSIELFHENTKKGYIKLTERMNYDYFKTNQNGKVNYIVEIYELNNSENPLFPDYGFKKIHSYNQEIIFNNKD